MICIARNPHNSQRQKINKRAFETKTKNENKTTGRGKNDDDYNNAPVSNATANITEHVTRITKEQRQ